jgi:hypothetical protein
MTSVARQKVLLFVDELLRQWVVRDPDGAFWIASAVDNAWDDRQPFFVTESCILSSVPEHYKYLPRLPF